MALRTIKTLYVDPVTEKIKFGFNSNGVHLSMVQDGESVTQRIIMKLFTVLGSNASQSESGSRFFRMIGANYSRKDEELVRTNLSLAFEEVVNQVIEDQDISLSPSLLVAGFEILSIIYDKENGGWKISVKINFENGVGTLITV